MIQKIFNAENPEGIYVEIDDPATEETLPPSDAERIEALEAAIIELAGEVAADG